MGTASSFLAALWGAEPPGQACIWRLPSKQSAWFTSWEGVDQFVQSRDGEDIYTGVALAAPIARLGGGVRIKQHEAHAITGLWADIDLAGPGKQKNYPPTVKDILDPINKWMEPTIWVHSGHGLQAWWLFGDPWVFESPAARDAARALSRWWQGKIRSQLGEYDMDSTPDLTRLLRLPGTYNNKAERVPVEIIQWRSNYYHRGRLLAMMGKDAPARMPAAITPCPMGPLVISADREPPRKILALLVNSPEFARAWDHRRRNKDLSASGYDLSLANYASQAGWSDQEIADLLIGHRRRWDLDLKLRTDYYQRTIGRVRSANV